MLNDTSVARKSIISSNCSTRDARSEAYSVMSGSSGVSIKSAIALKGPNRSDLVAQLLKSSPSFVQRRKSYSNKIGTSDRDGDGDKFAISKEWLVELLLGRIARNLPDVPLPTTVGSEQEPAEEACEAETHHAHSNSDGGNPLSMTLKHTTSSASLSSLSSARQLHQRRSKEQRLAIFKEELLQWMRPIVQQCNLHKRPVTWERCEIQASFLEDFHAWVVKQDPYTEPTVPAAAAPTPSFSPLWTKEGTVEPQVGRGARSFSPQAGNTEGGTRLGKVTLLGDDASPNRAGTEDTADAPTAGFSRNASFYSVNSVEGDGGGVPSCYLSYYVRNSDGTPSLTLMDAVEDTNYFVSQVLTRSYQLSCSRGDSSSPARRSRKKKRRAPNEHEYICWSDFTINLIMDDTAAENKTYEDTTYVRVHTVTLEEGAAETPVDIVDDDGDLSDSEDGRDDHLHPTSTLTLGGQRSRTNVNKNKNRGGPDISSQQTELEAFSKELKQLHNMSSDHVVVSPNGQRIYTSSKDSIVKVWEARRGQFIMNLLNVGKAWVMEMFLLHDGQYLMVVTTNAEITVVEVTSGSIVKKMRGCSSLETALSNVVQHSTEHIQRHGMKPGEMGGAPPDV
ncbi:hypothetical protein AGDE_14388 [Angomonas deanei]|uniref:Uncharacterized protein n=1 Tax=Angomonas deanei TaxID=59799 RepID=A0A7G2CLA6_9TRYP|nr:hypothetical protein AGDE_14388 [Angomonas deanei]CAD2219837.1 hypothetical protein, conserved [Angomonas deanei]|eukprot:EPY20936.1 hypothetical protein AGDE_14388 [Angomonas deanei]